MRRRACPGFAESRCWVVAERSHRTPVSGEGDRVRRRMARGGSGPLTQAERGRRNTHEAAELAGHGSSCNSTTSTHATAANHADGWPGSPDNGHQPVTRGEFLRAWLEAAQCRVHDLVHVFVSERAGALQPPIEDRPEQHVDGHLEFDVLSQLPCALSGA
jgi:hypothetical protein